MSAISGISIGISTCISGIGEGISISNGTSINSGISTSIVSISGISGISDIVPPILGNVGTSWIKSRVTSVDKSRPPIMVSSSTTIGSIITSTTGSIYSSIVNERLILSMIGPYQLLLLPVSLPTIFKFTSKSLVLKVPKISSLNE